MKKFFVSLLAVVSIYIASAQITEPQPSLTKEDYLAKSRQQKVGGWLLTSAGTIGLLVTLGADFANSINGLGSLVTGDAVESGSSYTVSYLLSAAALGSGVALLIASSKNKRRAVEMDLTSFLKMERTPVPFTVGRTNHYYPALAIRLALK